MPRLTAETQHLRRRRILESAWTCFSRDGFHATSMDQVIAASGMSANAVYRYFSGKDELIDATVEAAFASTDALFESLLAEPPPGPAEVVRRLAEVVRDRKDDAYDLSRLAMQAWTESLRRDHLRERVGEFYAAATARFEAVAQQWSADGTIPRSVPPATVARLLTTLMPGLVVMDNLLSPVDPDDLTAVFAALEVAPASARSEVRPPPAP